MLPAKPQRLMTEAEKAAERERQQAEYEARASAELRRVADEDAAAAADRKKFLQDFNARMDAKPFTPPAVRYRDGFSGPEPTELPLTRAVGVGNGTGGPENPVNREQELAALKAEQARRRELAALKAEQARRQGRRSPPEVTPWGDGQSFDDMYAPSPKTNPMLHMLKPEARTRDAQIRAYEAPKMPAPHATQQQQQAVRSEYLAKDTPADFAAVDYDKWATDSVFGTPVDEMGMPIAVNDRQRDSDMYAVRRDAGKAIAASPIHAERAAVQLAESVANLPSDAINAAREANAGYNVTTDAALRNVNRMPQLQAQVGVEKQPGPMLPRFNFSGVKMTVPKELESVSGQYAEMLAQYAIGRGLIGKVMKGGNTAAHLGKDAGAVFVSMDGTTGRLSDMIDPRDVPEGPLRDYVEFLKTQPDDSQWLGRFKNALEDLTIGIVPAAPLAVAAPAAKGARMLGEAFDRQPTPTNAGGARPGPSAAPQGRDPSRVPQQLLMRAREHGGGYVPAERLAPEERQMLEAAGYMPDEGGGYPLSYLVVEGERRRAAGLFDPNITASDTSHIAQWRARNAPAPEPAPQAAPTQPEGPAPFSAAPDPSGPGFWGRVALKSDRALSGGVGAWAGSAAEAQAAPGDGNEEAPGGGLPIGTGVGAALGWFGPRAAATYTSRGMRAMARGVQGLPGGPATRRSARASYDEKVAAAAVQKLLKDGGILNADQAAAAMASRFGDKPAAIADLTQGGVSTAAGISRLPGSTGEASRARGEDLLQNRAGRLERDIADTTGASPGTIEGDVQRMVQEAQAAAKPAYDALREQYGFGSLASARLEELRGLDVLRNHISAVERYQDTLATTEGRVVGDFEFWDLVKRSIDKQEAALVARQQPVPFDLDSARQAIVEEMDRLVPGYEAARQLGGEAPKMEAAFKEGQRLLTHYHTSEGVARVVQETTGRPLTALQAGVIRSMVQKAEGPRNTMAALMSTGSRRKLARLFGPDAANALQARFAADAAIVENAHRMNPNVGSVTSQAQMSGGPGQLLADVAKAYRFVRNPAEAALAAMSGSAAYNKRQRDLIGQMLLDGATPENLARIFGSPPGAPPTAPRPPSGSAPAGPAPAGPAGTGGGSSPAPTTDAPPASPNPMPIGSGGGSGARAQTLFTPEERAFFVEEMRAQRQPAAAPTPEPDRPVWEGPAPQKPQSLVAWIRSQGGIDDTHFMTGDLKSVMGRSNGLPGLLNRKSGKGLDDLTSAAYHQNFDVNPDDPNSLMELIAEEFAGNPSYRIGEREEWEIYQDTINAERVPEMARMGAGAQAGLGGAAGGAYGTVAPLQDMNQDGRADAQDRAQMIMAYGTGGAMTPAAARMGSRLVRAADVPEGANAAGRKFTKTDRRAGDSWRDGAVLRTPGEMPVAANGVRNVATGEQRQKALSYFYDNPLAAQNVPLKTLMDVTGLPARVVDQARRDFRKAVPRDQAAKLASLNDGVLEARLWLDQNPRAFDTMRVDEIAKQIGVSPDAVRRARRPLSQGRGAGQGEIEPKDLILGYNDGDAALSVGLDLDLPETVNIRARVTEAQSRLRSHARQMIELGQLDTLARRWNVSPDEIERFVEIRPHTNAGGFQQTIERIVEVAEKAQRQGEPLRAPLIAERLGMTHASVKAMMSQARSGAKRIAPELLARLNALKLPRGRPIGGDVQANSMFGGARQEVLPPLSSEGDTLIANGDVIVNPSQRDLGRILGGQIMGDRTVRLLRDPNTQQVWAFDGERWTHQDMINRLGLNPRNVHRGKTSSADPNAAVWEDAEGNVVRSLDRSARRAMAAGQSPKDFLMDVPVEELVSDLRSIGAFGPGNTMQDYAHRRRLAMSPDVRGVGQNGVPQWPTPNGTDAWFAFGYGDEPSVNFYVGGRTARDGVPMRAEDGKFVRDLKPGEVKQTFEKAFAVMEREAISRNKDAYHFTGASDAHNRLYLGALQRLGAPQGYVAMVDRAKDTFSLIKQSVFDQLVAERRIDPSIYLVIPSKRGSKEVPEWRRAAGQFALPIGAGGALYALSGGPGANEPAPN